MLVMMTLLSFPLAQHSQGSHGKRLQISQGANGARNSQKNMPTPSCVWQPVGMMCAVWESEEERGEYEYPQDVLCRKRGGRGTGRRGKRGLLLFLLLFPFSLTRAEGGFPQTRTEGPSPPPPPPPFSADSHSWRKISRGNDFQHGRRGGGAETLREGARGGAKRRTVSQTREHRKAVLLFK